MYNVKCCNSNLEKDFIKYALIIIVYKKYLRHARRCYYSGQQCGALMPKQHFLEVVCSPLFCDEVGNPPQGPLRRNPKRIVSASDSDQNWKNRTKGSMSHILLNVCLPSPKNTNTTYVRERKRERIQG